MIYPDYHEQLAGSMALPFVLREVANMIEDGNTDVRIPVLNEHQVSYLKDGDQIVAAKVWSVDHKGAAWVYISVIRKDYRGRGLYQPFYSLVENKMIEAGATVVYGEQWLTNSAVNYAAGKEGKLPFLVKMRKVL